MRSSECFGGAGPVLSVPRLGPLPRATSEIDVNPVLTADLLASLYIRVTPPDPSPDLAWALACPLSIAQGAAL